MLQVTINDILEGRGRNFAHGDVPVPFLASPIVLAVTCHFVDVKKNGARAAPILGPESQLFKRDAPQADLAVRLGPVGRILELDTWLMAFASVLGGDHRGRCRAGGGQRGRCVGGCRARCSNLRGCCLRVLARGTGGGEAHGRG